MKKMGRPKGDNNKEHVCTIRLDERTYRRLLTYCEKINAAKNKESAATAKNLIIFIRIVVSELKTVY